MKKMTNLQSYALQYPNLTELEGYGISVLTDIGQGPCAHCGGAGKDCERPCKPCHMCEGRGNVDVPLFSLGIPACPIRCAEERKLSPCFNDLSEVENYALANRDKLLREESARMFAI